MKKDNSTFDRKRHLRLLMLSKVKNPVVMETHGGIGKLFSHCYSTIQDGIVFERDPQKADFLAQQRPTWSVYRCDAIKALQAGAGSHLCINFLDLDPWGSPWEVVDAFFTSARQFADSMVVVTNDGLRQKLQLAGAWSVGAMQASVEKFGNDQIFKRYKDICREMLAERVLRQGYRIKGWTAYYCGSGAGTLTHWAAVLER